MTCGEGTRTNTRTHNKTAQFGGDECDGSTSAIENCKDQECPGIIFPTTILNLVLAAYNSAFCYMLYLLFRPLIYYAVHCVWDDWNIGDCSETCGEGTRNNTRTHKVAAKFGGRECNGSASAIEKCTEKECPGRICLK